MKKYLAITGIMLASIMALFIGGKVMAASSTVVVKPNSHYYQGWTFSKATTPSSGCGSENQPSTYEIDGALGSNQYKMTAAATPAPTQWQNCRSFFNTLYNSPVGNDAPLYVDMANIATGDTMYTFAHSLPVKTTYFLQDIDTREAVNVSFYDCSGKQIDSTGFDYLQASPSSSTLPSHTIVGTGASSQWEFTSTSANSPNETVGIIINTSNVCAIHNESTRPDPSAGGQLMYFGTPATTTITVGRSLAGAPGGYADNSSVQVVCSFDGIDVTSQIEPDDEQNIVGSGSLTFSNVPVGASCYAVETHSKPPTGYTWKRTTTTAPSTSPLVTVSDDSLNTISLVDSLVATTVPTPPNKPSSRDRLADTGDSEALLMLGDAGILTSGVAVFVVLRRSRYS